MSKSECDKFLFSLKNELHKLRLENKETQVEFAKRSKLHQSAIARIEGGTSPNVGIQTLHQIAKANFLSLSELIKRAEGESSKENTYDALYKVEQKCKLLSPNKRKWLAKIVDDILIDCTDN